MWCGRAFIVHRVAVRPCGRGRAATRRSADARGRPSSSHVAGTRTRASRRRRGLGITRPSTSFVDTSTCCTPPSSSLAEPRLQAHELGDEVAGRHRSGPRRRRCERQPQVAAVGASTDDGLRRARGSPASAPGTRLAAADEARRRRTGPAPASGASAGDHEHVVGGLAVEHVEHAAVAVDDPELRRRGPGTWPPACARGSRSWRRAGSRVVTGRRSTHGIASSSRSAAAVSTRSTGVPSRSSTTACSGAPWSVYTAPSTSHVVDGEQRRPEHGEGADDERRPRRPRRGPSAAACGRPPA